ncbi:MAG: hypothetical protein MJZ41_15615 [Bacteroidaceae bacterium]|nr:hypothetical protein [Bacteroidaceae bacterium]
MEESDYIHLEIKATRSEDSGEYYDYYNRYEYDVILELEDDSSILIGKGKVVLYLCGKAMNEGADLLDAFDENAHNEIYDAMFDYSTKDLKPDWQDIMMDTFNSNILVKERLEILPEYRHKGYGKKVRSILRSFFDGCYGVEVLHSFPLQLELFDNDKGWRAELKYDAMEKDAKKATQSLNRCYKNDGYTRYKRTQIFYRVPS